MPYPPTQVLLTITPCVVAHCLGRRTSARDNSDASRGTDGRQSTSATGMRGMPRYAIGVLILLGTNTTLHDFVCVHFLILEQRLREIQDHFCTVLAGALAASTAATMSSTLPAHTPSTDPALTPSTQRLTPRAFTTLLESHAALRAAAATLMHGICALYRAPRLRAPYWLTLSTFASSSRATLRPRLVADLATLIDIMDTPQAAHFLSRALTGVLMLHLGWIATVRPPLTPTASAADARSRLGGWARPSDPVWSQVADLYGAKGRARRVVRTIVVGEHRTLAMRWVRLFSYFIRCAEVQELDLVPTDLPATAAVTALADDDERRSGHEGCIEDPSGGRESPVSFYSCTGSVDTFTSSPARVAPTRPASQGLSPAVAARSILLDAGPPLAAPLLTVRCRCHR